MLTIDLPAGWAFIDLNLLVMKLLALAGGAAVGYLLVAWVMSLASRLVGRGRVPSVIQGGLRFLGALAGGFAVWIWLFSGEGSGGMGVGGWGPFGSTEPGGKPDASKQANDSAKADSAKRDAKRQSLRIDLLGGTAVQDQRFYKIEGDAEARTFASLTEAILQRRKRRPAIGGLMIVLSKDSVDRDNPAVTQLIEWAKRNGFEAQTLLP